MVKTQSTFHPIDDNQGKESRSSSVAESISYYGKSSSQKKITAISKNNNDFRWKHTAGEDKHRQRKR